MAWLRHYDPGIVRRDFLRIARAGMDTVRIFLLWEHLQPAPSTLHAPTLAHVVDAADAAADVGLDLIVTLFTGHMSGANFIPSWATGGNDGDSRFRVVTEGAVQAQRQTLRNWYADPEIVDAQVLLAGGVAAALAGHPAVWAWDLGNENSNCTVPPDGRTASEWLERTTSVIRAADPGTLITVGTHMEDLEQERRLGPAEAARWCDFVCMHGYPIYAEWSSGVTDEHLVPYLAELSAWLASDAPVLFEEFGHPTMPVGRTPSGVQVGEDDAAAYAGRTVDRLQRVGTIGALLWCYADYASDIHDDPPLDLATHERSFGLWRADGTPKPVVAELAAKGNRVVWPPPDRPWVDISPAEFALDRSRQLVRLYSRYREADSEASA